MWNEAHPLMRIGTIVMGLAFAVFLVLSLLGLLGVVDRKAIMISLWCLMVGFGLFTAGFIIDMAK